MNTSGEMLRVATTVEKADGGALVRIIDARAMMAAGGLADDLADIGNEAADRLGRVADRLASWPGSS